MIQIKVKIIDKMLFQTINSRRQKVNLALIFTLICIKMNLMRFASLVQFEENLNYWWQINIQKLWRNTSQLPYHVEYTGSRLITKVKQHWAWVVLGWETTSEHQVLFAFVMEKFIWNFVFDWFSLWFALKSLNKCYFRSSTKTATKQKHCNRL